jgi:HAD superfamily hydrolase (TIGR01458 family)
LTHARLDVDGLLLDMDGVLTVSWEPLPGAVEALGRLRAAGLPLRILTSTTALSRTQLVARLSAAGFDLAEDEVLAAAILARDYLREHRPGATVALLGDAQVEDLEGIQLVGLDAAPEVILLSGADESYCFANFNRVLRAVLDWTDLVAMHRNGVWMTHDGPCMDTGAYLAGLERACGREAVVTGKPAPGCFAAGAASLGLAPQRVAMVGDDVENDVLAAQSAGMTGVLVRTGKFRESALAAASGAPDHLIDSVAGLPALLGL